MAEETSELSDAERAARCAWLVFLSELIEPGGWLNLKDYGDTAALAHAALPLDARARNTRWRAEVDDALQKKLDEFCPRPTPPCCEVVE